MSTKLVVSKLRPLDYQILCKVLSKEIDNQIRIMENKKSSRETIAEAVVYQKDILRLFNYFATKRNATNNSIYAKFLHFFRKFIK